MSNLQAKKSTSIECLNSSQMIYSAMKEPGVSPGCCLPKITMAFFSTLYFGSLDVIFITWIGLFKMVDPICLIATFWWPFIDDKSFCRSE